MVDFQDPALIIQDLCACPFMAWHANLSLLNPSFDSVDLEALARPGWSLHVSPPLPNISNNFNSALRF